MANVSVTSSSNNIGGGNTAGGGNTVLITLTWNSTFTIAGTTAGFSTNNPFIVMTDGNTAYYQGGDTAGVNKLVFQYVETNPLGITGTVGIFGNFHQGIGDTYTGNTMTNTINAGAKPQGFFPCLVGGTLVLTTKGEVPVENLAIGDSVISATGEERRIKWIGRTFNEAGMLSAMVHLRPILISAGALGDALPRRDLRVSPMHGIALHGGLYPAATLVNGSSIVHDEHDVDITYYHVELETHDLLVTEGAATESFLNDQDSRVMFDNAAEYFELYGTDTTPGTGCLPFVREGYMLRAIRNRLAEIAGIAADGLSTAGALRSNVESIGNGLLEGWAIDADNTGRTVEVEVLVDGEVIGRTLANAYRPDLYAAGLGDGNCAFAMALPPSVTSFENVRVRRAADGLLLTHPAVAAAV